jgi:hypothetical protein
MLITRINRLKEGFHNRIPEWQNAIIMVCWGVILLLPYHTFDLPSYVVMRQVASEGYWGAGAAGLGAARIIVLIINGAWRRNAHARGLCAFLSCFVWLQVSFGLFGSGIVAPGLAVYCMLFAVDAYTCYRCAATAREADEAHKHGRH